MNRYIVRIEVPKIGVVKHLISARNSGDATAKAHRAHPNGAIISWSKQSGKGK